MAYLSDPKETIAILQKYQFNFQKKFGQNFLIDAHVVDKIVSAAEITKEDVVLEIGPGIGTMTQRLCEEAGDVVAIEIDSNLIPILRDDTCKDYSNLQIIHGDVMKLNLSDIIFEYGFRPVKVVANLPYYITTPILMKLLEDRLPITSITVMIQKEVADRIETGPGSKDYGALSLAVQYYAAPYLAANVPPNCFMPRPNVGSAVIRLTLHEKPPVQVKDEKHMFALIRASFNQRRKTLVNGLTNAPELQYTKEEVAEALAAIGFSQTVRGETLTLSDFAKLSDTLSEMKEKPMKDDETEETYPASEQSNMLPPFLPRDSAQPMLCVYAGPDYFAARTARINPDENPFNAGFDGKAVTDALLEQRAKEEGDESSGSCPACGAKLYARNKFCPECGALNPKYQSKSEIRNC